MKFLLLCVCLAASGLLRATSVQPMPLDGMVRMSDHVVVAAVVRVDMIDRRGRQVADPEARTGPGLHNTIRLHLSVREVLYSRKPSLPATMVVPLWSAWHYSLGSIREAALGTEGIFLLKGEDALPAYPANFQRALDERDEIERLLLSRTTEQN